MEHLDAVVARHLLGWPGGKWDSWPTMERQDGRPHMGGPGGNAHHLWVCDAKRQGGRDLMAMGRHRHHCDHQAIKTCGRGANHCRPLTIARKVGDGFRGRYKSKPFTNPRFRCIIDYVTILTHSVLEALSKNISLEITLTSQSSSLPRNHLTTLSFPKEDLL